MEKISAKKLPPIFKMSVLCNILPYYGHLHRWRRLLEKINTKTKDIWDQNREQLMYIGRDFKRDIELDTFEIYIGNLRPNRSWLDLFSLSLSYDFRDYEIFDFTKLTDNLTEDEVIIFDSHDDIFKDFQIHFWRKDRISDILPAIKCPSFKSETKIFKTPNKSEIREFIHAQNHIKFIVIENANEELSINLIYGNTIKTGPWTFCVGDDQDTIFFRKLQERYELWKIDDCACKPKKIRVWAVDFEDLNWTIDQLKWISNITDAKLGVYIYSKYYGLSFSEYDTIVFNRSATGMSDKGSNFIFTGNTLAAVFEGNYYNFRLDERTKESKDSYIKGKI